MSVKAGIYPEDEAPWFIFECDAGSGTRYPHNAIETYSENFEEAAQEAIDEGWEFRQGEYPAYEPVAICPECVKAGRA
jgi:hypothetical protein